MPLNIALRSRLRKTNLTVGAKNAGRWGAKILTLKSVVGLKKSVRTADSLVVNFDEVSSSAAQG